MGEQFEKSEPEMNLTNEQIAAMPEKQRLVEVLDSLEFLADLELIQRISGVTLDYISSDEVRGLLASYEVEVKEITQSKRTFSEEQIEEMLEGGYISQNDANQFRKTSKQVQKKYRSNANSVPTPLGKYLIGRIVMEENRKGNIYQGFI